MLKSTGSPNSVSCFLCEYNIQYRKLKLPINLHRFPRMLSTTTTRSSPTMAISTDDPTLDLYCNEVANEVVSSDSNNATYESDVVSNVLWEPDDESYILSLLESEFDQMQEKQQALTELHRKTWFIAAREEAVNWILKVHAHHRFRPETAYLSVNYLDRFLLSHTLPNNVKGWPLQLLSVACLALAAKMEETSVPLLLDLQMIEPSKFLFRPKTVQRMELLVMACLKWRLRVITPFDFAQLFITKMLLYSTNPLGDCHHIISRVSDIVIRTCVVMDFLAYPPSAIAAAAVLWASNQSPSDQKLDCFHVNINRETVKKCYKLIRQNLGPSEHILPKELRAVPLSPTSVLDRATSQESNMACKT